MFLTVHHYKTPIVQTACYFENQCLLLTRPVVLTLYTMVLWSYVYKLTDVTNLLILSQTSPKPKQNQVSLIPKPNQTVIVVTECNHMFNVAFCSSGRLFLNNVMGLRSRSFDCWGFRIVGCRNNRHSSRWIYIWYKHSCPPQDEL